MDDLTDVATLRRLCQRYDIRPDRDAGQHFLINREVLAATVAAAEISPTDTVLEIGPGFGTLTAQLAQRADRVIAVELDPKLVTAAKEILKPFSNVEIIQGNFLTLPPDSYNLPPTTYKLVANLPYGITGRFFRRMFQGEQRPERLVVMVQAEVAARLTAPPGKLSLLGVLAQLHSLPRVSVNAGREDFWPRPAVDSAVVVLPVRPHAELQRMLGEVTAEEVMRLARIGFAARRKTLANNLRTLRSLTLSPSGGKTGLETTLSEAGIHALTRAQELSVEQWITLAKKLKNCLN